MKKTVRGSRPILAVTGLAVALLMLSGCSSSGQRDGGSSPAGSTAAPTVSAGFDQQLTTKLDQLVSDAFADHRIPGGAVGIWIPGRGDYVKAVGTSDLKTKAPFTVDDHVRIGDISKTFTAVAILRLVDQGRLHLDDKLSRYVPGITYGQRITLSNLLGMKAGVYNFVDDPGFAAAFAKNPDMAWTQGRTLATIKRHKPAFAPGTKTAYSESDYVLLGMILEKASGTTVRQAIESLVIEPAGLTETSFPVTAALPSPYARGYLARNNGGYRDVTASNPDVLWTAGGMVSTLGDLRKWSQVLMSGSLIETKTLAAQLQSAPIKSVAPLATYGLGVLELFGFYGHDATGYGYSSAMFQWPGDQATFVVVGNQGGGRARPATRLYEQIARLLYPAAFTTSAGSESAP